MSIFTRVLGLGMALGAGIVGAWSQTGHSVEQGANYANDVYFSFDNGVVATVPAGNWDLAFEVTSPFSIGIRLNDGNGRELAIVPGVDLTGWEAVDSTGFGTWPKLNNGLDLWENGALNMGLSGDPMDFGWGVYTGPPLHEVVGDSLYILKRPDGSAVKLRVERLSGGVWSFTHAQLDGSNEVSVDIAMADFANRNFVYYDVEGGVVDREPATDTWDLLFTRYMGPTQFGLFPTTGVLVNRDRLASEADGVDVMAALPTDYPMDAENISVIGNDWKALVDFVWQIVPNRCYFVTDAGGDVHKLYFTGFTGSSTGITTFNTLPMSAVGVAQVADASFRMFPNPLAESVLQLDGWQGVQTVEVFTVTGERVWGAQAAAPSPIALGDLPAGVYLVQVGDGAGRMTQRLIKQ